MENISIVDIGNNRMKNNNKKNYEKFKNGSLP